MRCNWLKRLFVVVKAKLGLEVVDSNTQNQLYPRSTDDEFFVGIGNDMEERRTIHKSTMWWNRILDSRELTYRCISGQMDAKTAPLNIIVNPNRSFVLEDRFDGRREVALRPDSDKKSKKHDEPIRPSRPAATSAPPPNALLKKVPRKSQPRFRQDDYFWSDEDHGAEHPRKEKQEKSFTEKEYLQILEEQNKKPSKQATVSVDRPLLPPHFIQAVDMLITQMNLSRNEFSERSLLDVKIYDRIKRKENWNPKADTCKAILFALRPNVITALQLYHLAGYTFRECDEDLLLLCMFGVGDYDIETYNSVMASRGLRELGSKSKK